MQVPADFSGKEYDIVQRVLPYTMTSPDCVVSLIRAIDHVVKWRIPGDIVECGVWRGGSVLAAALALQWCGDRTRSIWLYDTFSGMTAAGPHDADFRGNSAAQALAANPTYRCESSLEDVQATMAISAYPADKLRFVEGIVADTIPAIAPEQIAILRLDTDWYDSTKHELTHLYPRLARGGILIVDDYGHWQGARKAVDEYFDEHQISIFLSRVDYTCRLAVKP